MSRRYEDSKTAAAYCFAGMFAILCLSLVLKAVTMVGLL